jgi:hypothetical protein
MVPVVSGVAGSIVALILIGAVVGGALAVGAPIAAIPIAAAILVVWGGARVATKRERIGIGEEDVRGEAIEFDERDRQTLTPSARPAGDRPRTAS